MSINEIAMEPVLLIYGVPVTDPALDVGEAAGLPLSPQLYLAGRKTAVHDC